MDGALFMWIFVTAAAILVGSEKCPYTNPQVRSMTCIKDLPSIKFRPVDIQKYQNTDSKEIHIVQRVHQRHEKRGSLDETEVIMTPAVDFPPPSTPEMTFDFLNYFCSDSGAEIVRCTSELDEKCSEHPSMREALFNPGQALKAQSLCRQYVTYDLNKTLHCINVTMASERVAKCLYVAYSRNIHTDRLITSHTRMCSSLAEAYNCFIQNIGSRCGSENVGFIISVMRSMEPRYCNNLVDAIYSDPLKQTSSSISYKISSFIVLLTLISSLDVTLL